MLWYAARNALLPTVSSLAIALGTVLGGSLVTEVVFNYPGLGNTLYQAILARDYPVIQGQLLIMTAAMLDRQFPRRSQLCAARSAAQEGLTDGASRPAAAQQEGAGRASSSSPSSSSLPIFAPLLTDYSPTAARRPAAPAAVVRALARHDPHRPRCLHPPDLRRARLARRRLRRRAPDHGDRHRARHHRRL